MAQEWQESWTMSPFAGLLTDAIAFDAAAQSNVASNFPAVNRSARAAVTSAVLSLEAGANCCVARMDYPKLVLEQLDKLSVIDKYAVLFEARYRKKIDKGSRPFQIVQEMSGMRNRYVHPKLSEARPTIAVSDRGDKTHERGPEQQVSTSILKLPLDFTAWTGEHSRTVVRETLLFFNHFFSELCAMPKNECANLLSVIARGPVNSAALLAVHELALLNTVKTTYGVDIDFLVI